MTNGTKNYYTSSNYVNHTRFGGNVYNYDFDGYNSINGIAARIVSDWKFDCKCKQNTENRIRQKNFKNEINVDKPKHFIVNEELSKEGISGAL